MNFAQIREQHHDRQQQSGAGPRRRPHGEHIERGAEVGTLSEHADRPEQANRTRSRAEDLVAGQPAPGRRPRIGLTLRPGTWARFAPPGDQAGATGAEDVPTVGVQDPIAELAAGGDGQRYILSTADQIAQALQAYGFTRVAPWLVEEATSDPHQRPVFVLVSVHGFRLQTRDGQLVHLPANTTVAAVARAAVGRQHSSSPETVAPPRPGHARNRPEGTPAMSTGPLKPADLRPGDVIVGLPGTAEPARVIDHPYLVPVSGLAGFLVTFTVEWPDGSRFTVDVMSDHEYQVTRRPAEPDRHDRP